MNIRFTRHATEQMEDRKISRTWIDETIKAPDETRRKGRKYYLIKKLNGRTLKVVYVKEKYINVITCYVIK